MVIHICYKCMFQMFHLFQTYVASVLSGCCICCSRYTLMLQVYISNVSPVSDVCRSKCFILWVFLLAGAAAGEGHRCRWSPPTCTGTGAQHRSEAKCTATGTGLRACVRASACGGRRAGTQLQLHSGQARQVQHTVKLNKHAGWAQGRGRRRRPDVRMLATPLLQDHRHS